VLLPQLSRMMIHRRPREEDDHHHADSRVYKEIDGVVTTRDLVPLSSLRKKEHLQEEHVRVEW
jgi:hypothetical protein